MRISSATQQEKPETSPEPSIEEYVDKAKRAFALKKYEESVEHYATALEKT